MDNKLEVRLDKISDSINNVYSRDQLAVIKNTVAKGTTDTELAYFIYTANSVELNPLNKEIWAYKDNKGNLIVFAGRDGFLKKAQKDPRWNGIVSSEVRANDSFEVDIPNGEISHKPNYLKDRGAIVGAYCKVKPKDTEIATIEWVDFKTYFKGGGSRKNVWDTHPADMIKKVAEVHALKKAYGISGIQSEYDFTVKGNTVQAIETEYVESDLDKKRQDVIEALSNYEGEDKEEIQQQCVDKRKTGEDTIQFYDEILEKINKYTL